MGTRKPNQGTRGYSLSQDPEPGAGNPEPVLLLAAVTKESRGVCAQIQNQQTVNFPAGVSAIFGTLIGQPVALVLTGVGPVRAAAVLAVVLAQTPFSCVLQFGVGGAYPHSGLNIGDLVLAESECDPQTGLESPEGFRDLRGLGFPITDHFPNKQLLENNWIEFIAGALPGVMRGGVATVATCSATDALADRMEHLTGAKVEAMEGFPAAWVSAQFGIPFAELRAISNTTGDRARQQWDLSRGCDVATEAVLTIFREMTICQGDQISPS
ncbi:MAG TPA: futalosine hydrolase [Acidobacteriota bacterium]|nr:futalosine hydrolase [Acidobacteriota bacterium]